MPEKNSKLISKIKFLIPIVLILVSIIYLASDGRFLPNYLHTRTQNENQAKFKWGIGINPYPIGKHTAEFLEKVLKDTQELGADWIRVGWPDFLAEGDDYEYMDKVIDIANEKNLNIFLGFSADQEINEAKDPYQEGYTKAYRIAGRYGTKVNFYQLANEPAAFCLKEDWPGLTEESFDKARCQPMFDWLRGASDGIVKANPYAKRVITGHWLHVGFMQMAILKGIDFEIIGWDWNGMPANYKEITNDGKKYNLAEMLKSCGKELWISEVNSEKGSLLGEEKQADYLKDFIPRIYNSGDFSGLFVFRLHDEIHRIGTDDEGNGLIKLENENGVWDIGDKKKAFFTYQQIIKKYR